METRTCQMCGATFETDIEHQVYCSSSCRLRAQLLRQRAKRRQRAAENAARRIEEKSHRAVLIERAKADAERKREEARRRAIEKWGSEERYQAHLDYQRQYRLERSQRLRSQLLGRRANAIARFRVAEAQDEMEEARRAPAEPASKTCSVCGCDLGPDGPDLCCLCSRAVTRENAEKAAASESQWALVKTRFCHDCGRPSNGYRCPRCLHRWRKRHGVSLENAFEGRV